MKTLILNGSPRKNGDSMHIINKLTQKLKGEVVLINVYDEKTRPCIDCRYCWTHDDCAIKDDMFKVYDILKDVDNVILSSPVYFTELSGPLLSYVSRFQRYYTAKREHKNIDFLMKSKKGAVILSAGDIDDIDKTLHTARVVFWHINTKIAGTVTTLKTNTIPAKNDQTLDEQIENLAEILNA